MPGLLVSQFAFYQISSIHHPSWFPLQDYPRPASFMVQKLWASEPHAWSGLTPALQPVKDDGAMWPQHWALWRYISAAVSCRSSPRNASFVQNCPMDGWMEPGVCRSYRPLQQHAKSWASTLKVLCCQHIWVQLWVCAVRDCWPPIKTTVTYSCMPYPHWLYL